MNLRLNELVEKAKTPVTLFMFLVIVIGSCIILAWNNIPKSEVIPKIQTSQVVNEQSDFEKVVYTNNQNDSLYHIPVAQNLTRGTFMSVDHAVGGTVRVAQVNNQRYLFLENFQIEDGPSLHISLSENQTIRGSIDLGNLRGIRGDFQYAIPHSVNLTIYDTVIIWSDQFDILFSYAELK